MSGNFRIAEMTNSSEHAHMTEQAKAAEILRTRIRELMSRLGTDPTRLAKQLNRNKDYIRDFLDGRKESISPYVLSEIERIVELDAGSLSENLPVEPGTELQENFEEQKKGLKIARGEPGMFSVYGSREIFGTPEIWITRKVLYRSYRPNVILKDDAGYGLLIEGVGMSPAYEPGETIFLGPSLGIRRNTDIVAFKVSSPERGNEALRLQEDIRACIGRLIDITNDHVILRQFNPDQELRLPTSDWSGYIRIAAKHSVR